MAAPFINAILEKLKGFWQAISLSQRVVIGALATLAIGAFIGGIIWLSQPEFSPLYTNLGEEDANRVIKALEKEQIPYRLERDGTVITVPSERVNGLRISIAGQNLLTGKGVGFELFNEVKVGETDFVQKLKYRRALEGELARTITEFPTIEGARVHLVLPHRSLFIEEQKEPSASVLLKIAPNKRVETKDVEAIVNLVSMSVEGLDRKRISIADTSGKVLYQPEVEGSLSGMNQTQFEHKLLTQQTLERRIEELLMPVVGPGHVVARVNADMDFSQRKIKKKLYDPEKTVVRSEQRSEQSTQGRASIDGGTPDPNFRGDGPAGNVSDQSSSRETRTTNFEINEEEQDIITTTGDITRLTIAVVVDGSYVTDADGNPTYTPRSAEEIKVIRQLVSNAIGFDSARGDTIEVSNIPFGTVDIGDTPTSAILADYALRFGKPLLNAILIFLFLILVIRPIILALIRPKVEGRMLEGLEGLAPADERLAIADDTGDEAIAATAMLEKIEDIKIHALQLSEQNMDQAIGIIKSWLKDKGNDEGSKLPARAA